MNCTKALEPWDTKAGNCEVTPQALSLTANSLMKMDRPKAPTALHGPLGITNHPNEKTCVTADCLENQFTSHDLCDEIHEQQVKTESKLCSHL
jgi:hypothetical protein